MPCYVRGRASQEALASEGVRVTLAAWAPEAMGSHVLLFCFGLLWLAGMLAYALRTRGKLRLTGLMAPAVIFVLSAWHASRIAYACNPM